MKAVVVDRYGGPEVLRVEDVEKPAPAADEVLVRNEYIGVGKPDYLSRSGIGEEGERPSEPFVIGNECAGVVEAVGCGVTEIRPGMKVCVNSGLGYGAYAEYISVPRRFVTVLPDEYPLQYAPGLLNYYLAWALLNEAACGTNVRSLYITGAAGGVGTAVIQTALLQGIEVLASTRTEEKCAYIKNLGARYVFNSTRECEKDAILAHTDGRGVDLILDQRGGANFWNQLDYLADFGLIVLYNWLEGFPPEMDLQTMLRFSGHGMGVRAFSFHAYDDKPARQANVRKICLDRIMSGKLTPRIYADLPLEQAVQAHQLLDGDKIEGKLILHV